MRKIELASEKRKKTLRQIASTKPRKNDDMRGFRLLLLVWRNNDHNHMNNINNNTTVVKNERGVYASKILCVLDRMQIND